MNVHIINKDRRLRNIFGLISRNKFDNTWDNNNTFFSDQAVPIYFKRKTNELDKYLLLLHYNYKKSIMDQFFEFSVCEYLDPYDIGRKRPEKYECLIQNLNLEKKDHLNILKDYNLM